MGVFISEGMRIRIPVGGLTIGVDETGKMTSSLTLEVSLDVWPIWLDVAMDHAVQALQARAELEAAVAAAGDTKLEGKVQGALMTAECRAGMVAIAAAAFALDNFYSVVRRFAPSIDAAEQDWQRKGVARHRRISETLRRTFKVPNAGAKQLRQIVAEVFRFRDWAVHPPADFKEPLRHDLLESSVEWRFVAFRATNAANAAGAATSLVAQCIDAPRESNLELVKWCKGQAPRAQQRLERAKQEFGGRS